MSHGSVSQKAKVFISNLGFNEYVNLINLVTGIHWKRHLEFYYA